MRKPILLCCFWLLSFIPPLHAAQTSAEDWFEIEVLLFKRNQPENLDEQWPQEGERRLGGARQELIGPFAGTSQVPAVIDGRTIGNRIGELTVLSADQLQLTQMRHRLGDNALFQPLLHVGWRQHVASARGAVPVHLFAGKEFSGEYQTDGHLNNGAPESDALWELDGLLQIHLQHYLFINTDFLLREPGVYTPPRTDELSAEIATYPQPDNADPALIRLDPVAAQPAEQPFLLQYPFHQQRRVRSGEIHYFDHPMFGMIIQIRRIE